MARFVSCGINFLGTKHFAFKAKQQCFSQLIRYMLLAICLVIAGYSLVHSLHTLWHVPIYIGKLIAELLLFPASFFIQRWFVFYQRKSLKK